MSEIERFLRTAPAARARCRRRCSRMTQSLSSTTPRAVSPCLLQLARSPQGESPLHPALSKEVITIRRCKAHVDAIEGQPADLETRLSTDRRLRAIDKCASFQGI